VTDIAHYIICRWYKYWGLCENRVTGFAEVSSYNLRDFIYNRGDLGMKLPTAHNRYSTLEGELHHRQSSYITGQASITWTNMSRAGFEPAIPLFGNLR
jgi:hypothetical protein